MRAKLHDEREKMPDMRCECAVAGWYTQDASDDCAEQRMFMPPLFISFSSICRSAVIGKREQQAKELFPIEMRRKHTHTAHTTQYVAWHGMAWHGVKMEMERWRHIQETRALIACVCLCRAHQCDDCHFPLTRFSQSNFYFNEISRLLISFAPNTV